MQKRIQWVFAALAIIGCVVVYAQNPISIAQVGTTAVGSTVPVSGTVTAAQGTAANLNATVVGTGTFATQAAQSGTWTVQPGNTANTTPWLVTGSGSAGTAASGVVTVQGITSMTPLLVTPSLPALASTSTKQSDGSQKSQIVDGSGNVIGSTSNALDVNIKSGAGSGGTALADEATFTQGTTQITPIGGLYKTAYTALTSGMAGVLRLLANGAAYVNLDSVQGTAIDVNSGSKSAGTLRVVIATDQPQLTNKLLVTPDSVALPANQSVNVAQMNGVTTTMGNGAAGTGVQRVAIASDNTVLPAVGAGATGSAVPANAVYQGAQDASGNLVGDIVCTVSKIYDASTSGNTELVAISGSKHIYVCHYTIFAAGTVNVSLVTGTGTACASAASGTPSTGTSGASAGLTPAYQLTAQTGKVEPTPTHGFLYDTGSANALCLKTSGAVAVQGEVWYSQR